MENKDIKIIKNRLLLGLISIFFNTFFLTDVWPVALKASSWIQEIKKEPLSEHSKQWLEEVVPYIITPAEKEIFLSLPNEEERGKFIENFWKKRDPNPETPENEFKIAYYRRIALANKFFGYGGIPGWKTDRGKIFILLGPPNEIQHDYFYGRSSLSQPGAIKEVWTYWNLPNPNLPYCLEFTFIDAYGTGDFKLETSLGYRDNIALPLNLQASHAFFDQLEFLAESLKNPFEKAERLREIITTQVSYELVPFICDFFIRKGSEESNQAIIFTKIPLNSLEFKYIDGKNNYSITLMLNISNNLGQKIFEKIQNFNFQSEIKEKSLKGIQIYSIPIIINIPPGEYGFHVLALDNFSGKIGTFHKKVFSPDFRDEKLALSNIFLFSPALDQEKGPTKYRYLSNEFKPDEEITLELEVYNVQLNPETKIGDLTVKLLFFKENKLITSSPPLEYKLLNSTDAQIRTSLRLHNFEPGNYRLRVEVEDKIASLSCLKEIELKIVSN